MAFQLPPDDPVQMLTAQAEAFGNIVGTYHSSLLRNGLPIELVHFGLNKRIV